MNLTPDDKWISKFDSGLLQSQDRAPANLSGFESPELPSTQPKPMNLTPAETWHDNGYNPDAFGLTPAQRRQNRIKFIRQIQADALRAAAEMARRDKSLASIKYLANQLSPQNENPIR